MEALSWDQSGLGYRNENGTLDGSAQFADSLVSHTVSEEFEKILDSRAVYGLLKYLP